MAEPTPPSVPDPPDCEAEIARLSRVIQALMDRAERSTSAQASDFSLFQTTIILEEQVRARTAELEAALRLNEEIARDLRESEARFRSVLNQSLVGIVVLEDGRFTYANPKYCEIFGCTADEMLALPPLDTVVEADRMLVAENIRKREAGEADQALFSFRGLRKDGGVVDIELHGNVMDVGGKRALVSVIMDVTERNRAEHEVAALQETLREQSIHDALTGLYNRRYLEESFGRELVLAHREGHLVSVIMGDLDHFKAVNDRYGHQAGDEVLRTFGGLMKQHARGSDVCCRYGGEEFLLVLPGMPEASAVERAEELRTAMAAAPVAYGERSIAMTASFGVATYPRDGRTGDELIAAADGALYAAKAAGRNRVNVSSGPAKR